ncbi:MAG: VacJ family lipoprotein, partial [Rhodovarius sp.]|nr:VacJ family lipoprotein [Rhodovarius sp.]
MPPPALAALLWLLLVLAGCGPTQVLRGGVEVPSASALYAGAHDPADPWERMNRGLMDLSLAIDDNIARPVAETYRAVVPEYGRTRIRLFLRNLGEPLIFAHNLLQLRPDAAGVTLARFALNTTLGGLGLFDVATDRGLPRQSGDMGQTLARYGIPDGPFLFVPIAGPSTLRDAVGDAADGLLNPVSLVLDPVLTAYTLRLLTVTRTVLGGVDLRAENLDTLDA